VANVQEFTFTTHAIDRYVQRVNPEASYTDAKSQLVQNLDTVRRQKQNTRDGSNRWLLPKLKCVLVTRREEGTNLVLTIITQKMEEVSEVDEFREWVEELGESPIASKKSPLEWRDILSRVTSLEKKRLQRDCSDKLRLLQKAEKQTEAKITKYKSQIQHLSNRVAKLEKFLAKKACEGDTDACYLLKGQTPA